MTSIRIPSYDPTDFGNKPGEGPHYAGGQRMSDPLRRGDLPSTLSHAAERQVDALKLVNDLWGGTQTVRDEGMLYLPKSPGEHVQNYNVRLQRSVLFNVFRHTVETLAGFVFRKDPHLGDDVPPVIAEHWENVDLAGTHGDVFARDRLVEALAKGHAAILVDYPNTGGGQTLADEQGMRPYWVPILKDNILSWRATQEAGRTVLTQVVLRECVVVPDGDFGDKVEDRYRVFLREPGLVRWALLRITPNKEVVLEDSGIVGNQDEIPLVEIPTSGRKGLFESDPPLLDLAYLNVAHYQQWSDYATSIHKTCVPIFVTAGLPQDDKTATLTLGPDAGLNFSDPQGRAEYVSHDGAALASCKQALDDLIRDMASLGVSALASQKRQAETAQAKQLDKAASDSLLAVAGRALQDALERALDFHARYLGLDDGGSVSVNDDFQGNVMEPAVMIAFATLAEKTGLPIRVILEQLQAGGRIDASENLDELEAEMMAQKAAQDEQKAMEAEAEMQHQVTLAGMKGKGAPA